MSLRIFNTLTGRREEFVTREPGAVHMYLCGITPYSDTHLGHARPSVFWDAVIRYLEYLGYRVKAVQNVTDVNEKVAARAALEGMSERELAEKYNDEYDELMQTLGVAPVDHYPWVSDHMEDIISMIGELIERGHAYEIDGEVYFDVQSYPDYGKLSGQCKDELVAGSRVQVDERKKHPADFALWKRAPEGMRSWDSPWGPGRPGWHIECSAMSLRYLGFGFDVHAGGTDLVFPHHENEIAQSEAFQGEEPFVRFWVHHGMITGEDGKMSKSLGNFVTVRELLEEFRPEVLRHFLLSGHYGKPLTYSRERVREAEKAWRRFVNSVRALHEVIEARPRNEVLLAEQEAESLSAVVERLRTDFCAAMDDDLNTSRALGALFEAVRRANSVINASDFVLSPEVHRALSDLSDQIEICARILGIWPREGVTPERPEQSDGEDITDELLDLLIRVRNTARERKLFDLADEIRDGLADLQIKLEDTPEGTRIRRGDDHAG